MRLLNVVDRTTGGGKRSGILKTTTFFALTMRLSANLFTDSKKHSAAARLLAAVSLDGSIGLAHGDDLMTSLSSVEF